MNAEGYRGATFVALLIVSAMMATGAEPPESKAASKMTTPMPACAELENVSAVELVAYLEKDRQGLSGSCVEFAIRQLAAVTDQLSIANSERAIGALMPFLDFPRMVTGKTGRPIDTKWYPAKITIVGATNSVVQRLEDAHRDSGPVKQHVLDRLIGIIADTAVSRTAADSAAWAVDEIMAYPNAPTDALPAVATLARAAKASADAASSARLWDEARKLAATCTGLALRSQCDAALN
jgi:hypothetical protein